MRSNFSSMGRAGKFLLASAASLIVAFGPAEMARAQSSAAVAVEQQVPPAFTQQQIEKLVAPIALYPDALLAQVLPAAAYPSEIVRASRWLARNRSAAERQDFSAADAQRWDPSVKALLRFPTVLEKLNADLDWTVDLGEAFVNQPQEVASAIQTLREQAAAAGALQTNAQHRVRRARQEEREIIIVEPAEPSVIYVPVYDPVAVYRPGPSLATVALVSFGTAIVIGRLWSQRDPWNWRTGALYRPVWPGYPAWRAAQAPSAPSIATATRPWRPDAARYRPAALVRPALARPVATTNLQPASRPATRPAMAQPNRPQAQVRPAQIRQPSALRQPQISRETARRPQVSSRPVASRPVASRPVASRPVASRSVASRPIVSRSTAARPAEVRRPASRPVQKTKRTPFDSYSR